MERRSARRTTPRKRYTVDAFEGIEELQDAASDQESSVEDRDDDSAQDFIGGADEPDDDEEDDDEEMSGIDGPLHDDAQSEASDAGERMLDDNVSIADDLDAPRAERVNDRFHSSLFTDGRYKRRKVVPDSEPLYTRGLQDVSANHAAKHVRRLYYFGPSRDDQEPVEKARMKWGNQPTLPSRHGDKDGFGGLHRSFSLTEDAYKKRAQEDWTWFHGDGCKAAFSERQLMRKLDSDEVAAYVHPFGGTDRSFLLGPYNDQKLFKLRTGNSMPIGEAWRPTSGNTDSGVIDASPIHKPGFVLNLGAKVNCLDWMPNCSSETQYLAASVLPLRETDHALAKPSTAPAFTPQPPQQSAIQIWELQATEDLSIDVKQSPKLQLVLCTAWGDIRALKWCISPCDFCTDSALLAVVFGDGALRIINIPLQELGNGTEHLIEKVAFESKPPDTICTCLTWLDASRVAAGCANGCVAVWNLSKCLEADSANPRPYIYSSISTSYILAVESCYPSHPDFLITTSFTGYMTLTDLRRPQPLSPTATALSQRNRLAHRLLLWHDFAQTAISVDDSCLLRGSPLRRWFAMNGLGKTKSLATCMAGSLCHPFILVGCANGQVVGTNPLRRMLDGKSEIWQQTWFAHEWRRPTAEETAANADGCEPSVNERAKEVGKEGLSRILEGYKPERVTLSSHDEAAGKMQDGVLYTTIYEEPTAISALAWNPNLHVGGWAAAGMADGLLRVEDIAA